MNKKILLLIISFIFLFTITGCGNKDEIDDENALKTIKNAMDKVYDNNEIMNTRNVQKYMVGNWTIVEAPRNNHRESVPQKIDETTIDNEWTTMYITACNSKSYVCKDLRIFRNGDEGELFVGSETDAAIQNKTN